MLLFGENGFCCWYEKPCLAVKTLQHIAIFRFSVHIIFNYIFPDSGSDSRPPQNLRIQVWCWLALKNICSCHRIWAAGCLGLWLELVTNRNFGGCRRATQRGPRHGRKEKPVTLHACLLVNSCGAPPHAGFLRCVTWKKRLPNQKKRAASRRLKSDKSGSIFLKSHGPKIWGNASLENRVQFF